jgi:hypothetical protein
VDAASLADENKELFSSQEWFMNGRESLSLPEN